MGVCAVGKAKSIDPSAGLDVIRAICTPEEIAAGIAIARDRLRLTPEKIALILVRLFNPDEIIEQGEEATLRGLRKETLKAYKDEGLLPRFVNGKKP